MGVLSIGLLIRVAVIAGVAFVIWRILQPKYDVRIVIAPDGIREVTGVARGLRGEIERFLQENLPEEGKVIIGGIRQPNGRMRLVFRGPINQARQQRFRNFFSLLS